MEHKTQNERRATSHEPRFRGSAILLAIVLTSLLAIIGVMFLLSSRVESVATSSISDNKDLMLSVDTVVAAISQSLAIDVSLQADPNQYCDYPDPCNPFLASLEPYYSLNYYWWSHISDPFRHPDGSQHGILESLRLAGYKDVFNDFAGANNLRTQIVLDSAPVTGATATASPSVDYGGPADADGDGVADSRWVKIPAMTSSKGKPIFAAIRVIDNGGMLNVNTGFIFNPNSSVGSSQMDVNLMALSWRPYDPLSPYQPADETSLLNTRSPVNPGDFPGYERDVIWRYESPYGPNTPFDISDELEMRNRFVLNHEPTDTRLENWSAQLHARNKGVNWTPFDNSNFDEWSKTSSIDANLIAPPDREYAYRHIATTYNYDRIIVPDGNKMFNINKSSPADSNYIRNMMAGAFVEGGVLPANADILGAQITANLIDYIDGPDYPSSDPRYDPNNDVTVVYDNSTPPAPHFGFEQPCIYISELAQNFFQPDANEPNIIQRSYAIELHKTYAEDLPPGPVKTDWSLVVASAGVPIPFTWAGNSHFHIFYNDDFNVIDINFAEFEANSPSPLNGAVGVLPNVVLHWPVVASAISYSIYFGTDQIAVTYATPADANVFQGTVPSLTTFFDPPGLLDMNTIYFWRIDSTNSSGTAKGSIWRFTVSLAPASNHLITFKQNDTIILNRRVFDPCSNSYIDIIVDAVTVPVADLNYPAWLDSDINDPNRRFETHSFQRDISNNMPIRRLWDLTFGKINNPTIGQFNEFFTGGPVIQAHPTNESFTNVGEFGQLFFAPTYAWAGLGPNFSFPVTESEMRIDLALPAYQQIFRHLTVMDPCDHGWPGETRIKGRININTAPWFVLAQLPWISYHTPNWDLARSIADYRENTGGFKSIGELMNVGIANNDPCNLRRMDYYFKTGNVFPALTPPDGDNDEFEKRDAIFARISNLVTVRSDVFTAYILVRIGQNGPQKRAIAILDRSGVTPAGGKVKIVAIHPVPDPR